jgi:glycosyltransferase involved in cell wall biosynthesis
VHKDKIGVIIPFYGFKQKLFRTLASVENQTVRPDIVLLIDDCSPDPLTKDDESHWQSKIPQLMYLYNDKNLGAGFTRNVGMDYLEGKVAYLHFLDSDDCIAANFYEEMRSGIESKTNLAAVYSKTEHNTIGLMSVSMNQNSLYDGFFQYRPWATCSILWRQGYTKGIRWSCMKSSEDTVFELNVALINDKIAPIYSTFVSVFQEQDERTHIERNKATEALRKENEGVLYAFAIRNIPLRKFLERGGRNTKLWIRGTIDGCREDSLKIALLGKGRRLVRGIKGVVIFLVYLYLKNRVYNKVTT